MFFKFLKKSLEAAGFKLVEKNFIKNINGNGLLMIEGGA